MATASDDQLTKVSTEAATDFVQAFYGALQSNRSSIESYYCTSPTTILFNGNQVADGAAVQEIFTNQMPNAKYDAQSFDCQIINRTYPSTTPNGPKPPSDMTIKDMSLLVMVSGHVRYGEGTEPRGFSETFMLIPNPTPEKGKRRKEWLIQSQNFRLVV